ncbi:hypothetical protein TUM17387_04320 [Shewanella carassii]|nr:hypothetical protein [Shewanella carassii]BCV65073.1 hypothetical protein TUM17387_04320 [Shewanella carassii]
MAVFVRKLTHMLIALVVLQFCAANIGAHQLHLGNHTEEENNHPHLKFVTEVTVISQCVDCTCEAETSSGMDISRVAHSHVHTESQEFDLCLDCQCHGGHLSLPVTLAQSPTPLIPPRPQSLEPALQLYFPFPDYRPPIA